VLIDPATAQRSASSSSIPMSTRPLAWSRKRQVITHAVFTTWKRQRT